MLRRTTTAVILALALIAAACATGGTPQAEGPSAVALTPTSVAPSVATVHADGDATSEGIQVHGHWTIEVRDPDGSVVDRWEFDNALTAQGADHLVSLLGGRVSAGTMVIVLTANGATICDTGACAVDTQAATVVDGSTGLRFKNRYTGSLTATKSGNIAAVELRLGTCSGWVAPNDCSDGPLTGAFTETSIDQIAVDANQAVYVTVEIRFS